MSSSSYWVPRKQVDKQYRPKGYGLSPGLQRARAPFRTRNALTGLVIGAFVFGVWAYSISAVKQDTFEDLDEEAKELLAARMADERIKAAAGALTSSNSSLTLVESARLGAKDVSREQASSTSTSTPAIESSPWGSSRPQGILASRLSKRFPNVLDPASRTLVWGAPPVDRVGRLGDKNDGPT